MILTTSRLKELSGLIQEARQGSGFCNKEYIKEGKNYRLEFKPNGNKDRLEKSGFICEFIGGDLFVHIPLGCHGSDNLGIDIETEEIVCLICKDGV